MSRKTTTINLLQINEEDKSGAPSRADKNQSSSVLLNVKTDDHEIGKMQSPKSPTKVTVDHTLTEVALDVPLPPSKKTSGE